VGARFILFAWEKEKGEEKIFFPHFHILIFDEFSPFHPNEAISSFGSVFDDSEHRISRNEEKKKQKCAPSPPDDLNW